jgi:hypothetical protein
MVISDLERMYFTKELDTSSTGAPLMPPAPLSDTSTLLHRFSSELSILVLVATNPSKAISLCRSMISSSCVKAKSGAILRYSGFHFSCFSRIAISAVRIFFSSSLS